MTPGLVSLVGAGPGDPELLTLRAVARLQQADVVLYDALVDPAVLAHAPHARRMFVGKRAGRHSIAQETIERVMIRRALRGERVVRLKCGDPFVFGRGGEEALAMAAAGVPCEVVPGVSSALAAAGACGIPLTHRGLASAFVVVSGHAPEAYGPMLSSLHPGAATVVILMGLGTRAATAAMLLARGWDPQTPAAVLLSATEPSAASWRGTLATLAWCDLPAQHPDSPGVIVVGAVVSLAGAVIPSPHSGARGIQGPSAALGGVGVGRAARKRGPGIKKSC
ncbi:MAG TPA: uroporphyrinogen-III C-methyltransferase [Myxococcales bacterium]|nr:uroporphyrinogen-III C-methyltransferase [Myxococcales bacterium]